jgi:hypothetical protein
MYSKVVPKAEVIRGMGFGREDFDALVSVGMLPTTKRLPTNHGHITQLPLSLCTNISNKVALLFLF